MADTPERKRDGQKLDFELFKHLTTLNTATALVVLALGEAFKAPSLATTFGMIFFGISLVLSVLGMVIVSNRVYRGEPEVPEVLRGVAALFVMGLVAFVQEAAFGVF